MDELAFRVGHTQQAVCMRRLDSADASEAEAGGNRTLAGQGEGQMQGRGYRKGADRSQARPKKASEATTTDAPMAPKETTEAPELPLAAAAALLPALALLKAVLLLCAPGQRLHTGGKRARRTRRRARG